MLSQIIDGADKSQYLCKVHCMSREVNSKRIYLLSVENGIIKKIHLNFNQIELQSSVRYF